MTKDAIRRAFEKAKAGGSARMLIVWDRNLDYDFPFCVSHAERAKYLAETFYQLDPKDPEKKGFVVMECYNLQMNLEAQLAEYRAFNW